MTHQPFLSNNLVNTAIKANATNYSALNSPTTGIMNSRLGSLKKTKVLNNLNSNYVYYEGEVKKDFICNFVRTAGSYSQMHGSLEEASKDSINETKILQMAKPEVLKSRVY